MRSFCLFCLFMFKEPVYFVTPNKLIWLKITLSLLPERKNSRHKNNFFSFFQKNKFIYSHKIKLSPKVHNFSCKNLFLEILVNETLKGSKIKSYYILLLIMKALWSLKQSKNIENANVKIEVGPFSLEGKVFL